MILGDDPGPAWRANVGIVLFNAEGKVWLGRRAGTEGPLNWQFPQGGVDPGEDWLAAAHRELQEETGVTSVSLLDRTQGWIVYDFPAGFPEHRTRKFRGQKQVWFAFRFEGDEAEIRLDHHEEIEFDAWRWANLPETLETVVAFKREAYGDVIAAFARFAG